MNDRLEKAEARVKELESLIATHDFPKKTDECVTCRTRRKIILDLSKAKAEKEWKSYLIFVTSGIILIGLLFSFSMGLGEGDYAPYKCERSPTYFMKYTGLHYVYKLGCLAGQRIEE